MGYRHLSDQDRDEIWDLHNKGFIPLEISKKTGRAFSTVAALIKRSGGIRPAKVPKPTGRLLSLGEREEISRGVRAGETFTEIAGRIGRSPSTVSREVGRNGGRDRYRAISAQAATEERARRPKVPKLAPGNDLGEVVRSKLELEWSPEQISFPVRTGHETTVLDLCADGDPIALCAWAGALAQPPRIVHSPGMIDEMFDRGAIENVLAELGDDTDPTDAMDVLRGELTRQTQMKWLDEHIPALGGLTPRQAAADPTRREQLERLLADFDNRDVAGLPDGFQAFTYDVAELRRELGID